MNQILIVDDEEIVASSLLAIFEAHDFRARTAHDRQAAEALIAREFFPIILADVRLQTEAEGLALLESIQRLSPRSRVASLTGYATAALERELAARGTTMVLEKPIGVDEIIAVVRELLEQIEVELAAAPDNEELVRATDRLLRSIPQRRYGFSREDAEELAQEAWCLFFEKQQSVRTPKTWLTGAVANLCKQEVQRRTRDRGELAPEPSYGEAFDATLAVRQALERLDPKSRTLCELIGLEQRSYEEVSAAASIPLGSVGPLYIRAKQKLRAALG
jgi:RNA polymerase sigma factor (sigma-70 family)